MKKGDLFVGGEAPFDSIIMMFLGIWTVDQWRFSSFLRLEKGRFFVTSYSEEQLALLFKKVPNG